MPVRHRINYTLHGCDDLQEPQHRFTGISQLSYQTSQINTNITFICCWQATPAVCQHKDTGASTDKNCHQYHGVCCFRCCHMEQLTPGTSNTVLLSTNFCAKTKETPVYQQLQAHLRIFYFAQHKCTRYYYYYYYYYYLRPRCSPYRSPRLIVPEACFPMLSSICLELTTFTRHQQRLSDDLQISEAENLLFRHAFDCSVHVWPHQCSHQRPNFSGSKCAKSNFGWGSGPRTHQWTWEWDTPTLLTFSKKNSGDFRRRQMTFTN